MYTYDHLNEFKLILCHSEGTRFSKLIEEMVEIETKGTHDYLAVLEKLGGPVRAICLMIPDNGKHMLSIIFGAEVSYN